MIFELAAMRGERRAAAAVKPNELLPAAASFQIGRNRR